MQNKKLKGEDAKQKVLDKFYPKYKEMSLVARVKIDQILQQKHGGLINKLTQKLGKVVKKKEIEKVRKARQLKKMISSFSQLLEQKGSVVFTFGRFNPPTTGHEKLIQKVASVAGSNPFRIYPSQSQNQKKDPLPFALKVACIQERCFQSMQEILSQIEM